MACVGSVAVPIPGVAVAGGAVVTGVVGVSETVPVDGFSIELISVCSASFPVSTDGPLTLAGSLDPPSLNEPCKSAANAWF